MLHVRRPDGQSIDAVLHANPLVGQQGERGVLFAFNPPDAPLSGELVVPLYYTGLTDVAQVTHEEREEDGHGPGGGGAATYTLERNYSIKIPVTIAANGYSWWVIR